MIKIKRTNYPEFKIQDKFIELYFGGGRTSYEIILMPGQKEGDPHGGRVRVYTARNVKRLAAKLYRLAKILERHEANEFSDKEVK